MNGFFKKHQTASGVIFFVIIVFLLLVSQTALWLNNYVFNTTQFTSITTTAIQSESSRKAIGSLVVEKALEDRPVLRSAVGSRLEALVAGLLDTDLAGQAFGLVVQRLQISITTQRPEPIVIELAGLRNLIVRAQELISDEDSLQIDVDVIPDQIVILDQERLPNFYTYGIVVLWLAPISGFIALGMIAWWLYKAEYGNLTHRMYILASVLALTAIVGYIFGPLFRPVLLSYALTAQAQVVLGSIFDGFVNQFNRLSAGLLVISALLALGTVVLQYIIYRNRPVR